MTEYLRGDAGRNEYARQVAEPIVISRMLHDLTPRSFGGSARLGMGRIECSCGHFWASMPLHIDAKNNRILGLELMQEEVAQAWQHYYARHFMTWFIRRQSIILARFIDWLVFGEPVKARRFGRRKPQTHFMHYSEIAYYKDVTEAEIAALEEE